MEVFVMLPSSFLLTKQRCSRVCSLAVGDFNTSHPPVITKINHLSTYIGKKQASLLFHCMLRYYSCHDPFSSQWVAHSMTVLRPLLDGTEPEISSKIVYSFFLAARKHCKQKDWKRDAQLVLLSGLLVPCLFSPRIKLPLVISEVICGN